MKSIYRIIREEFNRFIKENDYDDSDYSFYDDMDEKIEKILQDFLFSNNDDFTARIPWRVVPFARLKKIWEDYIKFGFVRDVKGLDMISGIMIGNTLSLNALTMLSGHTEESPDGYFEEAWGDYVDDYILKVKGDDIEFVDPNQTEINFDNPELGYKKKENVYNPTPNQNYDITNYLFDNYIDYNEDEVNRMNNKQLREKLMELLMDNFYSYYSVDSKGIEIMSDYGLKPLVTLAFQLRKIDEDKEKIVTIDKMLNVVHQRSDMASWFVQGGSSALSQISGYDVPTEDGYSEMSSISGKYNMSDY